MRRVEDYKIAIKMARKIKYAAIVAAYIKHKRVKRNYVILRVMILLNIKHQAGINRENYCKLIVLAI